eukprot:Gregarina_sp_Poly_1__4656@NODE_2489_length_2064_cov_359_085628_g1580_i0_p3_GENE_NODE_2489_length_2064_cov_359_085628_g1580_i0NODE_2489_length_2064_cov_359_085628_g1580_i0_p3_ORF_typecomplete_len139_score9_06_NODE_2489_length_2064_cov_359_085628_g1580_i011141530
MLLHAVSRPGNPGGVLLWKYAMPGRMVDGLESLGEYYTYFNRIHMHVLQCLCAANGKNNEQSTDHPSALATISIKKEAKSSGITTTESTPAEMPDTILDQEALSIITTNKPSTRFRKEVAVFVPLSPNVEIPPQIIPP